MPRETIEVHKGFTKKVTKNDIRPKDGSEPLTVIEFSLTIPVRESLKEAIDEYRASGKNDNAALAEIVTNHLPKEILEELKNNFIKRDVPATVYVVKNLPEIERHEIPNKFRHIGNDEELPELVTQKSYGSYIWRGLAYALNLGYVKDLPMLRYSGVDSNSVGMYRHQGDANKISTVVGTKETSPPLRFTDIKTLSEAGSKLQVLVRENFSSGRFTEDGPVPLNKLNSVEVITDMKPGEIGIFPAGGKKEAAEYEALVKKHSQEVVPEAGDLMLWAGNGRIYYEDLPKNSTELPKYMQGMLSSCMIRSAVSLPR